MPGSQTPHKLDAWPLTPERHQDLGGMVQYLTDRIVEYSQDLGVSCPKVDQVVLNDILTRLMTSRI